MSVRTHQYSVRLIHPGVAKSLCRALDRVLVCLAAMQHATRGQLKVLCAVSSRAATKDTARDPMPVLVVVARCLVEVLK